MGQRGGAMFQFVLAEFLDDRLEFGFLRQPVQGAGLTGIMLVDRLLDGHRAGHRGLASHQRRRSPQGETGHMPQRSQGGWARPALDDHFLEGRQMRLFLFQHPAQRRRSRVAVAQHGDLPLIDARRAEFPGMIDPDDPVDQRRASRIAGNPGWTGARAAAVGLPGHRLDLLPITAAIAIAKQAIAL